MTLNQKTGLKYAKEKGFSDITYFSSFANELPLNVVACGFSRWDVQHSFTTVNRDYFGFELVTMGDVIFTRDNKRYLVRPGEVFLHHQGSDNSYGTGPGGHARKRYISFCGPIVDPLVSSYGLSDCRHLKPDSPQRIKSLLKEIARCLRERKPGCELHSSVLGYLVLWELARSTLHGQPPCIRRALDFIEKNLQMPMRVGDISKHVGLSLTHFNRIFRKNVGVSPMAYVIGQRMQRAKFLLSTTAMSVKEVTAAVGYENPLYFSSQFKKHVGISPKFYRGA